MGKQVWRAVQIIVIILISIILGACAGTTSKAGGDPWEPLNRGVLLSITTWTK